MTANTSISWKPLALILVLASLIIVPCSKQVYAANYFINVTTPDFYSIWANGTNLLENQFLLNDTYYNGTYTGLIYNSDSEGIPTGETQTHDVIIFILSPDFVSFWADRSTARNEMRYNGSAFVTGNSDQDGIPNAMFLLNPYTTLGPYGDAAITVTHLRMGLFLGGFTGIFAPLAYIAGKRPNAGVVIKLSVVMLFGFALLLSIVDTV